VHEEDLRGGIDSPRTRWAWSTKIHLVTPSVNSRVTIHHSFIWKIYIASPQQNLLSDAPGPPTEG